MLEKFSLSTLATMDGGRISTAFEQALNRLRYDCEDRPAIEGKRIVTLSVTMEPVPDDDGSLGSVDVSFALNEKLPKRASKSYNMQAVAGGLLFNELSPDEVKQRTLDMAPRPGAQTETGSRTEKEVADVG